MVTVLQCVRSSMWNLSRKEDQRECFTCAAGQTTGDQQTPCSHKRQKKKKTHTNWNHKYTHLNRTIHIALAICFTSWSSSGSDLRLRYSWWTSCFSGDFVDYAQYLLYLLFPFFHGFVLPWQASVLLTYHRRALISSQYSCPDIFSVQTANSTLFFCFFRKKSIHFYCKIFYCVNQNILDVDTKKNIVLCWIWSKIPHDL